MEHKFYMDGTRSTSMTPEKVQRLESIGFEWARRKGEHAWKEKYDELKQYKDQHGNVDVPTKYPANPALGRWVSTQRAQYKQLLESQQRHEENKGHMTEEHRDLLNQIGMFCCVEILNHHVARRSRFEILQSLA